MSPPLLHLSRFLTAEGTSKNRIIGPSRILHFYNAPPDATEESLKDIFTKSGAILPKGIKFFSQGGKSATGLMEWDTIEEALESFVVATHTTVQASGELCSHTLCTYSFVCIVTYVGSIDEWF